MSEPEVPPTFWFYHWLDERGIECLRDFLQLLEKPATVDELQALASRHIRSLPSDISDVSILAGSGLDLSGFPCGHVECRIAQADDLFRRAWLYFDKIVIADPISPVLTHPTEYGRARWLQEIQDGVRLLLYLRQMGAEPLIEFQAKRHLAFCDQHGREALEVVGAESVLDEFDTLVERMTKKAKVTVERRSKRAAVVTVVNPYSPNSLWVCELPPGLGRLLPREAVKRFIRSQIAILTIDAALAKELNVPFGSANPFHQDVLQRGRKEPSPSQVVFQIDMPFLQGIPIDFLLRLREQEQGSFQRFRASIRRAIRERLKAGPDTQPSRIAREVQEDVIEPELRMIRARLKVAQEAMSAKTRIGVAVGSAVTTVGLITGLVPVLATGIAALAGGIALPRQQYIDQLGQVQLSDMFFLWKASEHSRDT